ncbi:glycerophosphodiester phosphodiesterase family protein [Pedobacter sp.]|jgi:glycerophosphoryl diester phosphodiesterase|uniref:glycerophosphodiester phosphodiesterase family protein n=1 Tax=Pedobacter sp. TaxID=1411316 RepID=UPI002C989DC3|nr:glycerophosphodiester phosphodiesterase family protein [Pedobacter sp.]HWW39748.1 glycerophosphodiester phosphodiesterase family protein [Pedobacter sp.]
MKKLIIVTSMLLAGTAFGQQKLDVQAHRGGMALMPENTIPAMINAVKLGARTLELDLAITSDGKVVVSHDPYMSSNFMRKPDGSDVTKEEEKSMALFKMTYDSISHFDSGSRLYSAFPEQVKMKTHKPLLSDLIDSVEAYVKENHLKPVYYNIETKTSLMGDGVYNPLPDVFVKTMMEVIDSKNIKNRFIIQSFDVRTLQILHKTSPKVKLALLVFGKMDIASELKKNGYSKETEALVKKMNISSGGLDGELAKLGFTPDIYSPYYSGVDADLVKKVHEKNMLILPWTVDKEEDMVALGKLGVDGIISNRPDLLVKLFGSYQQK